MQLLFPSILEGQKFFFIARNQLLERNWNKAGSESLDEKGTQVLKFITSTQLHTLSLHFFDTGKNAGFCQYKKDTNWL